MSEGRFVVTAFMRFDCFKERSPCSFKKRGNESGHYESSDRAGMHIAVYRAVLLSFRLDLILCSFLADKPFKEGRAYGRVS